MSNMQSEEPDEKYSLMSSSLPENSGYIESASGSSAYIWFDEVITRLCCLLDVDRAEFVSYLKLFESDDGSSSSGASKENRSSESTTTTVCLGSAARENFLLSTSPDKLSSNLIDPLALNCLEALTRWPKDAKQKPNECGGSSVPQNLLSMSIRFGRICTPPCAISEHVERLLEFIFSIWPSFDLSYTASSMWLAGQPTSSGKKKSDPLSTKVDQLLTPNSVSTLETSASLPPLATPRTDHTIPFVDDSLLDRATPCISTVPTRQTKHSLNSSDEYFPIKSMNQLEVLLPFPSQSTSQSSDADPSENSTSGETAEVADGNYSLTSSETVVKSVQASRDLSESVQSLSQKLHSVTLSKTCDPNVKLCAIQAESHACHARLVRRMSSGSSGDTGIARTDHVRRPDELCTGAWLNVKWPPGRSRELTMAAQFALLFLPPVLYARLRVLVPILHRVLLNHSNLACFFNVDAINADADDPEVQEMEISTSLDMILTKLSRSFASILFRLSTELASHQTIGAECVQAKWCEQLTCLLLSDAQGLLLQSPTNLAKYIQSMAGDDCRPLAENNVSRPQQELQSKRTLSAQNIAVYSRPNSVPLIDECLGNSQPSTSCNIQDLPPIPPSKRLPSHYASRPKGISRRLSGIRHRVRTQSWVSSTPLQHTTVTNKKVTAMQLTPSLHQNDQQGDHSCVSEENAAWSVTTVNRSLGHSCATQTNFEVDPQTLISLGNTAHLIKLLNEIINDRTMDPRRKMKCILDFQKAHADVYWLRFGNQETSIAYLNGLQRRIDADPQPTVMDRITNVFRRRRQSPSKTRSVPPDTSSSIRSA